MSWLTEKQGQSSTEEADVTLEAALRKNMGSVKDTPDGSRSVRFSDAKFFSRRDACTVSETPQGCHACTLPGSDMRPVTF